MGQLTTLTASSFLAATLFAGTALAAPVHAPARPAAARPLAAGTACMDNSRLVSHVAYLPSQPDQAMQCGHLLSTDTMLSVHHWDKT